MSILTDDISKLGGCLVSDFYEVDIKTPSHDEYRSRFIQAYGEEFLNSMASLEKFEHCLWREGWDKLKVKKTIENLLVPTNAFGATNLVYAIWEFVYRGVFVNDGNLRWGRQIHEESKLITIEVIYNFGSGISIDLLNIKLIAK